MRILSDIPVTSTIQPNIVFDFGKFIFRFMDKTLWSFANEEQDIQYIFEHYGKFPVAMKDMPNIIYYYRKMIIYSFMDIK